MTDKFFSPMDKLKTLAEIEGFSTVDALIQHWHIDSVCPGICGRPNCEYSTNVEPDSRSGWCEECSAGTIISAIELWIEAWADA